MAEMDQLKPGQSAYILSIGGSGALRHHLLDMGLTPKTEVTLQKIAPMGDLVQIKLLGYELTLRLDEAQKIAVEQVHEKKALPHGEQRRMTVAHPGMGELGRARSYHSHDATHEIPKGANIRFALAGNLFPVSLFQRGNRHKGFSDGHSPGGDHQYCGRHQY